MVRPLVLLTLVLGLLPSLCGAAFADGPAPGHGPPSVPPDVVILERTAVDPQGRTWVTGRTVMSGQQLVWWYDGAWQALPAPPARTAGAILPLANDDVWAAGSSRLAHWDGSAWTVTPHPPIGGLDVRDLAGTAADDVWAVGRRHGLLMRLPGDGLGERTSLRRPVTMHWDGRRWSIVRVPALPGEDQSLAAVACGCGTVWAVGEIQRLVNPEDIGSLSVAPRFKYAPLALQWRDGAWCRVRHTNYGNGGTYFVDVAVLPGGNAWTAGVVRASAPGVIDRHESWWTLVERRRGAHWLPIQEKVTKWRVLPWAIAAASNRDVWVAVMDDRGYPAAEHWDGIGWSLFPVEELGWDPDMSMVGSGVPDVATTGAATWLLGGFTLYADDDAVAGDPLVWRHEPTGWVKVPFALR